MFWPQATHLMHILCAISCKTSNRTHDIGLDLFFFFFFQNQLSEFFYDWLLFHLIWLKLGWASLNLSIYTEVKERKLFSNFGVNPMNGLQACIWKIVNTSVFKVTVFTSVVNSHLFLLLMKITLTYTHERIEFDNTIGYKWLEKNTCIYKFVKYKLVNWSLDWDLATKKYTFWRKGVEIFFLELIFFVPRRSHWSPSKQFSKRYFYFSSMIFLTPNSFWKHQVLLKNV